MKSEQSNHTPIGREKKYIVVRRLNIQAKLDLIEKGKAKNETKSKVYKWVYWAFNYRPPT